MYVTPIRMDIWLARHHHRVIAAALRLQETRWATTNHLAENN